MVVHDDTEMPVEVLMKPLAITVFRPSNGINTQGFAMSTRKFQIPELSSSVLKKQDAISKLGESTHEYKTLDVSDFTIEKDDNKTKSKSKKRTNSSASSTQTNNSEKKFPSVSDISSEDVEELKTAYMQCQLVIKNIESKYGHLLDLPTSSTSTDSRSKKRSKHTEDENHEKEETECSCTLNKKIVFDEEGQEIKIDATPNNHICPNKLMLDKKQKVVERTEHKNIQVEYHSNDIELSDNLQELRNILRNPNIETTYRNQVINKLRVIKLEHSNEIKFNKHSLIEKLKANPDEVLNFKGSNLSVFMGYS